MNTTDPRELIHNAFRRAAAFSGWGNFGINVRDLGPARPWNYDELARDALRSSSSVLDLDTGGGEKLASLLPVGARPAVTATEGWAPNAAVAAATLSPLGVTTVLCSNERPTSLPFRTATFDLVLNRHGGILPGEIDRVLCSGGTFLTQQVDPGDWPELRKHFPRTTEWPDNVAEERADSFRALGYTVSIQHHSHQVAYGDIGDLTFNLAVAPWTIPDLAYDRDLDALLALDAQQTTPDGLLMTRALYLLVATKP